MSRPTGFTLLEVLLATSLLTVLTTATLSWMATQSRSNRSATQHLQDLATAHAVASALRDDLLQALPDIANKGQLYTLEQQKLRFTTLNHMPGDEPGLQVVQWRQDARLKALVREIIPADPKAKPITRIVSRELRLIRFGNGGEAGGLCLICGTDEQSPELSLPVTRAGMP